jgi:hypothetical protein
MRECGCGDQETISALLDNQNSDFLSTTHQSNTQITVSFSMGSALLLLI